MLLRVGRLCRAKRGMRIVVVTDQDDLLGVGMVDIQQGIDLSVRSRSVLVARTLTLRQPAKGSTSMKLVAVPTRSYSWS